MSDEVGHSREGVGLKSDTSFRAHLPVRIAFGGGAIAGCRTSFGSAPAEALVVVEEPVAGHADVVAALAAAEAAGVVPDRFVKGPGEPTFALADELTSARARRLDVVVGIGGGSALDVAKAARIVADQEGSAADYADGTRVPARPQVGLVLCPTTSGTGSEVSGASVLTDTDRDRKIGAGHPNMRAQHALVDPVLTTACRPADGALGVDAMAQAIGACTVRNSSPLSVALGLEACHHVAGSLREAVADGSDTAARARLSCASLTAGLAMNLRLRRRPRARAGARQRRAPSARPHHRARPRRDARAHAGRLRGSARARRGRAREPAGGRPDGSRAVRAVRRVLADVGSRRSGTPVSRRRPTGARRERDGRAGVQPRDRLSRLDGGRGRAGVSRSPCARVPLTRARSTTGSRARISGTSATV